MDISSISKTVTDLNKEWRPHVEQPSLPEVFRSIPVPKDSSFWKRLLAFLGPGYMIAVGYMDPGNWATDITGGSIFNYHLLSIVLISSLMAIFLQALSVKLGIVMGHDLAQACRDSYKKPVSILLWLSAQIAIVACDIAEVIGAGIALNLLFRIPLLVGCLLTSLDVLLILALQGKGFRVIEGLVFGLIMLMMGAFAIELVMAKPDWGAALNGLMPSGEIINNPNMLYISLGILGATVMPHNLYLHSAIVQTRDVQKDEQSKKEAIAAAHTDSSIALVMAFFVNAAILVLSAAAFYRTGHHDVGDIQSAYKLLTPLLGGMAAPLFAIALLASGQNSTLTGTLAGQIVMEGFMSFPIKPWIQRMISRLLAIVPTIAVIAIYGAKGTGPLLVFSQVVLSLQLSCAVIPLVQFTSDPQKMGVFVNRPLVKGIGWTMAIVIAVLNLYLVATVIKGMV